MPMMRSGARVVGMRAVIDAENEMNHVPDLRTHGGRHDAPCPSFQVAVELAGGLIGLDLADARHLHVVGVGEVHRLIGEPDGLAQTSTLVARHLGPLLVEVRHGPAQPLGGVVVGARPVLAPPWGHVVSGGGPQAQKAEVAGVHVVVLGDLFASVLASLVLVPVGEGQGQQVVEGEA